MIPPKIARMPQFAVRVCGVEVSNVTVRVVIGSGQCPVKHELIFEDGLFGIMPLDDTLNIEIWRIKGALSRQKWQATNVRELYAELILSGGIDVVGASEDEKRAR
jgi:hypothetical protein